MPRWNGMYIKSRKLYVHSMYIMCASSWAHGGRRPLNPLSLLSPRAVPSARHSARRALSEHRGRGQRRDNGRLPPCAQDDAQSTEGKEGQRSPAAMRPGRRMRLPCHL